MSTHRYLIAATVLFLAASASTAYAAVVHSGYQRVTYLEVQDDGDVSFKLDDDAYHYYKCTPGMADGCLSILLTATAGTRDVKAYYNDADDTGTCPGIATAPCYSVVTTLRTR